MAAHTRVQATSGRPSSASQQGQQGQPGDKSKTAAGELEGDRRACTIGTVAAQSGRSRVVVALLKNGDRAQLRVQEMRPGMLEIGLEPAECAALRAEQRRLLDNLRGQSQTPVDAWWQKYQNLSKERPPTGPQKMVYLCMAENVQACWRSLLGQLEQRSHLLEQASSFYEACERLVRSLDRADRHVQRFRRELLDGPESAGFEQALSELEALNKLIQDDYTTARFQQGQLVEQVDLLANSNLADSRPNRLTADAQKVIRHVMAYLGPLEQRKIQLESVVTTTTTTKTFTKTTTRTDKQQQSRQTRAAQLDDAKLVGRNLGSQFASNTQQTELISSRRFDDQTSVQVPKSNLGLREIQNFNDLNLVEDWLKQKLEQLNSTLLSSLGVGLQDSRTILSKHEQIALECRAIEEAALTFNGRSIHSVRAEDAEQNQKGLLERQKLLAGKARDVINILDARIILLRRAIDFYLRSRETVTDIETMLRRLQVDNSLQSIQFVSNELELKDVSSVVASGATILSELQQLQLAQQHGQRSRLVSLNLVTGGIRAVINQLNQELAHLKTVLGQRRLVLLNEDATKMASNFTTKCQQLRFWLDDQAKSFLDTNRRLPLGSANQVRAYCDAHVQMRSALQNKTLEVEALLRSLPAWSENFDASSKQAEEIQRTSDELRQDWIKITNQLDRRLELISQYLALLDALNRFELQIDTLERHNAGDLDVSDGRTHEELMALLEQTKAQLTNQVQKFAYESRTSVTDKQSEPDMNWLEISEFVEQYLDRLVARLRPDQAQSKVSPARQATTNGSQSIKVPEFSRQLGPDRQVEPFSRVELECETTGEQPIRVEWFMNNFKRIPNSIKHSTLSSGNLHRLTINSFGPTCCGTYIACATNQAGQALSQCRLRLMGIEEDKDEPEQQIHSSNRKWSTSNSNNISRLIKGVDSFATDNQQRLSSSEPGQPQAQPFPVTQSSYSGSETVSRQYLRPNYYVESPVSTSSLASRSLSKSPLDGSAQAPVFVQGLRDTMAGRSSRAGLVCLVVGNPAPTIEWLHNNQTIATAKCQRPSAGANVCKLTIETMSDRTQGQYECRASNRAGMSSTGLTLSK